MVVRALISAVFFFAVLAAAASAQTAPSPAPSASPEANDPCGGDGRLLATLNRPTIGFSACAVAKGTTVFEVGYQNATLTGSASGNLVQYTQDFTRIGVRDRFEVDVILPNFNRTSGSAGFTHGYSDAGAGFKYEFVPKSRFLYGIDGLLTLPTGSGGFSSGGPGYTTNLNASYSASPNVGFGTTLAFSSLSGFSQAGAQSRYFAFMPSAVITAQIPNAYQFYFEYVYLNKVAPDLGARSTIDFGVQKLLSKRLEFDLELGRTLNAVAGAKSTYIGAGFGIQL